MALFLASYEAKARKAVKAFWSGRDEARFKQTASGRTDQGERSAVTSGKNMNGFIALVENLVRGNGLRNADIHLNCRVLSLPGYFRPTKLWDMIVIDRGVLVAALEFESQVGHPSETTATIVPRKPLAPRTISGLRIANVPLVTFRARSSAG